MESSALIDETLNKAFIRVKDNFQNFQELKRAFQDVGDDINDVVRSCADNVRVVIYIDEILDDPIVVSVGKEQNRLQIIIKEGGNVEYSWTKQTWSKVFLDAVGPITKGILAFFASKANGIVQPVAN